MHGSALQSFREVTASGRQGWSQAERNSREQGKPGREREHARIDVHLHGLDGLQRRGVHEQPQPERRYEKPGGRSEDRQHQALGHELAHQARPAGTKRRADRELPFALGGLRDEQARHVGTGDQQHKPHGAEQDEEQRPCAPVQPLVQRHDIDCSVAQARILKPHPGQ